MDTVDLKKLVSSSRNGFAHGVALAGETLTVVAWTVPGRRRMPELVFSRSDATYLVLEGTAHVLMAGEPCPLQTGQLLSLPRGVAHQVLNPDDPNARVLLIRAPGRARVEDLGIGRVECPLCACVTPVEKGDRPGDRFVCNDCTCVIRLEDKDGRLHPADLELDSLGA